MPFVKVKTSANIEVQHKIFWVQRYVDIYKRVNEAILKENFSQKEWDNDNTNCLKILGSLDNITQAPNE